MFRRMALEADVVSRQFFLNGLWWWRWRCHWLRRLLRFLDADRIDALALEVHARYVETDPLAFPVVHLVAVEKFRDHVRVRDVQRHALILASEVQHGALLAVVLVVGDGFDHDVDVTLAFDVLSLQVIPAVDVIDSRHRSAPVSGSARDVRKSNPAACGRCIPRPRTGFLSSAPRPKRPRRPASP